jgi:hypothetical protein
VSAGVHQQKRRLGVSHAWGRSNRASEIAVTRPRRLLPRRLAHSSLVGCASDSLAIQSARQRSPAIRQSGASASSSASPARTVEFWMATPDGCCAPSDFTAVSYGSGSDYFSVAVDSNMWFLTEPVRSLWLAMRRDFPWRRVPAYVVTQLVGATVACLFLLGSSATLGGLGATQPGPGIPRMAGATDRGGAVLAVGIASVLRPPPRVRSLHCSEAAFTRLQPIPTCGDQPLCRD